jgi:hypothetical protein
MDKIALALDPISGGNGSSEKSSKAEAVKLQKADEVRRRWTKLLAVKKCVKVINHSLWRPNVKGRKVRRMALEHEPVRDRVGEVIAIKIRSNMT